MLITAFYTYMKAMRGLESARLAIGDLVEFGPEVAEQAAA